MVKRYLSLFSPSFAVTHRHHHLWLIIIIGAIVLYSKPSLGFQLQSPTVTSWNGIKTKTTTATKTASHVLLAAAGRGFGRSSSNNNNAKTYGKEALSPRRDLIDMESAMNEFFSSNEEWKPLFRSIIHGPSSPAMSFVQDIDITDFEFHQDSSPWKLVEAIPTQENDRKVLATFLDSVQASLMDIPVDETTKEDENDLHFIEEGRRMLVCSRFHVIQAQQETSIQGSLPSSTFSAIERFDNLFSLCWSEILHLRQCDEKDTGSIILVPGTNLDDLRRFTDMNLQRPLQWLGIDDTFEVASMHRGSPAIRLIHKLSDMPDGPPSQEE